MSYYYSLDNIVTLGESPYSSNLNTISISSKIFESNESEIYIDHRIYESMILTEINFLTLFAFGKNRHGQISDPAIAFVTYTDKYPNPNLNL
jgi:hypothetical protein